GVAVGRDPGLTVDQIPVVPLLTPDEDPHALARDPLGSVSSVLQRLPHLLQQQSLPRVHELGIARRDLEEHRIELVVAGDRAYSGSATVEHVATAPPGQAFGGDVADRTVSGGRERPELVEVARAGKAPAHADDHGLIRVIARCRGPVPLRSAGPGRDVGRSGWTRARLTHRRRGLGGDTLVGAIVPLGPFSMRPEQVIP